MTPMLRSLALLAAFAPAAAQTTWYVDISGNPPGSGSPNDPYTSIQYAIDQPSTLNGDTLLVATGRYLESVDFRGKELLIDGSGADPVPVIDAGGVGTAVLFQSGEGPATVLRGFVVTGATSSGIRVDGASPLLELLVVCGNRALHGAGLWVQSGGAPLIRASVFEDNVALDQGGAAIGGTFEDCTFRRNRAGWAGGALCGATARGCRIEANDAGLDYEGVGGGALLCHLEACTVIGNRAGRSGGGVDACTLVGGALLYNRVVNSPKSVGWGGGSRGGEARGVLYRGNYVASPTALGGGAYDTRVADCIFSGNEADRGGGAFFWGAPPVGDELRGCTFFANRARYAGGGIYYQGKSGGTCVDSILWGNAPDEIAGEPILDVSYSCVEGGYPGTGNIPLDPLLFGPAGSDAHLREGSPCIDAGDPNGPPDFDGTRADIGAVPFDAAWIGGAFPYCSPSRTEAGCLVLATSAGSPSLSGPDDFVIGATGVPPGVPGLLFYGLSADAIPYFGGLLCVATPLVRMDLQLSTPAIDTCGGTFRQPFSQATLNSLGLSSGDRLYLQYWFRPVVKGRTSEAVEAYVQP